MSVSFRLTTLPVTHLAQAMGASLEEAKTKIDAYLSASGLQSTHRFIFSVSIKQANLVKYFHLAYASVPETAKKMGEVQINALKRNTFIAFDLDQEGYQKLLEGEYEESIKEYIKDKDIKIDASSVIGLIEDHGGSYTVYLAYK